MILKEALENYYYHTGKASDIARYMGYAGLAIVWLFTVAPDDTRSVPSGLVFPTILIVIGLALDLLQYVTASLLWGRFHRQKEHQGVSPGDEVRAPDWINRPAITLFTVKLIAIGIAYVSLLAFLASRLF